VADGTHSLSDLIADFVVLFASHHNLMTHVDPWRRPDLDHAAQAPARSRGAAAP